MEEGMFMQNAYTAGVDVGSTQAKSVVLNGDGEIVGRGLCNVHGDVTNAAREVYELAVDDAGLEGDDITYVIGTGYGRFRVGFGDDQVTEISCHAKGAKHLFPETRTVIDVGGQDTKAIQVGPDGDVEDFNMNDKCSAGTGRFLQSAAKVMEIDLNELGPMSLRADGEVEITTTCTVFAESEIISYVAKGRKTENILYGVHKSITERTVSLAHRVGVESEVTFTGGVSKNDCIVQLMNELLETEVNTSDDGHYMGAIGAALFALERSG